MLVRVSHEECEAKYDRAWQAFIACKKKLDEVTADRDEWKQQHENLLEVRRQDLAALARKR
jgi:hypothetical protein